MRKALVIGVGLWIAIASVVAIIWSPTPTLRQVSGVYLVWFISNVVNWIFLATMVRECPGLTLNALRLRADESRESIAIGARTRTFWIGYWVSFYALIINTIAPFFLFIYLPFWTAVAPVALNTFVLNGGAPFVRVWAYHAAKSQVSVA